MIYREQSRHLIESSQYFPVIAIVGPRQSGKTTLAKSIFSEHVYVSLENPDVRDLIQRDPRTFFVTNKNKHGIILDEFQQIPTLLSYIQQIVDEDKIPGYFVLTGSQNFLMNPNITQSLAGRIAIHTLLPLSIKELEQGQLLSQEIEEVLFKGCYPALYSNDVPSHYFYANYIQTYLERDVRLLTHVSDLSTFQTFITLCASRIGQLLNFTALAEECGISDNTVRRWLSILEANYIIYLLYPHYTNLGKRVVKSPKIYFYDSGLACYLLRMKQDELATHPNKCALFESFIIGDIIKHFYNTGERPNIYFWQDKLGHEIDCIIDQVFTVTPLEIKVSRTPSTKFFDGLNYWNNLKSKFQDSTPEQGFVVYSGSQQEPQTYQHLVSWQAINKIYEQIK